MSAKNALDADVDSAARTRAIRHVLATLLVCSLILLLVEIYHGWTSLGWFSAFPDYDFDMGIARHWLADGSYFLPAQLNGPHQWAWGDVLYPPVALYLFVPFSFLPMVAWFAVPFTVISAGLLRLRPALWSLSAIAVLLCWPTALVEALSGNTLIWFVAIEFAALAWGTPMSLGLFKPSLFVFSLFGVFSRRWWAAVALLAFLSLPFIRLSFTWIQVVLDERGRGGYPTTSTNSLTY